MKDIGMKRVPLNSLETINGFEILDLSNNKMVKLNSMFIFNFKSDLNGLSPATQKCPPVKLLELKSSVCKRFPKPWKEFFGKLSNLLSTPLKI
jgi:hypothetical protein